MKRDKLGRFVTGYTYRLEKPYWNRDWLIEEYINKQKSAKEIAVNQRCNEQSIYYFLEKLKIKVRSISEARKVKYWGSKGADNPMYNRRGKLNHRWKGGVSPERQSFYTSEEWKKACSSVWKRDKALCQKCNVSRDVDTPFHVHHIISFANKRFRAKEDNMILLCESCHIWVHSNRNKNKEFIGSE